MMKMTMINIKKTLRYVLYGHFYVRAATNRLKTIEQAESFKFNCSLVYGNDWVGQHIAKLIDRKIQQMGTTNNERPVD